MTSCLRVRVVLVAVLLVLSFGKVQAQTLSPDFSFDSFAGTYYLDRDSNGVATLSVQEDMIVEFPLSSNLYGIKRLVPESYQGHSLNLKIISLTDTAGNPVNYKLSSDGSGNEVITTGDPAITISGIQTYRLKYQTSGVVALGSNSDEFLIDVNGRGWQEPFKSVKAFIHLDKTFATNLLNRPGCYIGYGSKNLSSCTVKYQALSDGEEVSAASAAPLIAQQALVVEMDFKKGTFNQQPANHKLLFIAAGALVVIGVGGLGLGLVRRRKD